MKCSQCKEEIPNCTCATCPHCGCYYDNCECESVEHQDLDEMEIGMTEEIKPTIVTNNASLQKDEQMLMRASQVLAKFASTLALQPVTGVVTSRRPHEPGGNAPAWSEDGTLYLNKNQITNLDKSENLVALRGVALHESAHMMFTPTNASKHMQAIIKHDLWRASNILEDQRIEMTLTAMFSNVDDWLTAAVARYALNMPQDELQYQLPLLWGRKYLDPEVRKFFYDIYPDTANRDELCQLIDEYVGLNLNDKNDQQTAFEIIRRIDALIKNGLQSMPEQSITLPDPTSPTGESTFTKPGSGDGWDNIKDTHTEHMHKQHGGKANANAPSAKQRAALAKKIADAVAKDKAAESANAGSAPSAGDGNGSGDEGNDGDPIKSHARRAGGGSTEPITDWAKTAIQHVINEQAKVLDTMRRQVRGELSLDGRHVPAPRKENNGHEQPSVVAVQAVKSFARELEELKAQYDPAWERKVDTGRLNVQRYATGCEVDEAFDQWDMGREDAVDIECVIVLDTSGSMSWTMSAAFQYMWAIKRAMDKVGAATTVVGFDNATRLVYSADERASHLYRTTYMGGSTEPLKALQYAQSVLGNSKRAIKVLIPITDGEWYDAKSSDDIIRAMRNGGVITALAMLNEEVYRNNAVDSHGCEVAVSVTDASQLYLLARNMVKVGINRNLAV